jgi:multicomponent Na+:H+ antiporter subunit E
MRRIAIAVWLGLVWCALWRDVRPRVLVAGVVVGFAVTYLLPLGTDSGTVDHRVRPIGVLNYLARFAFELPMASLRVARQVLSPGARDVQGSVVEVPIDLDDRLSIAIVANTLSLTPGTITVEVDPDGRRLLVHVLDERDAGSVPGSVERWARLADAALRPTPRRPRRGRRFLWQR